MKYNALIPVKSLAVAKSRLSQTLMPNVRKKLVLTMLEHVVQTLTDSQVFDTIFVATSDKTVLRFAKKHNATPLFIPLKNINTDLRNAAHEITSNGSEKVLTISADLPWVTVADIHNLVALIKKNDVVLVPSKEGTGTNALFCQPFIIPFLFGKDSLAKFQKALTEKQLQIHVYNSYSIAFDIDTPKDLEAVQDKDTTYASFR